MKNYIFLLFFIPLSIAPFGGWGQQAKPPVKVEQVGTGNAADAGKLLMMDANGRGILPINPTIGGTTFFPNGAQKQLSNLHSGNFLFSGFQGSPQNVGNAGAYAITMPKTGHGMPIFKIRGYNYQCGNSTAWGPWELSIGFHNWTDSAFYAFTAYGSGALPFNSVSMGYRNGKLMLIIGETSSVWCYPQIIVERYYDYGDWNGTYTGEFVTSLAAFTKVATRNLREEKFKKLNVTESVSVNNWDINTLTNNFVINQTGVGTPVLVEASTGNVGIGTLAPQAKLDVAGGIGINIANNEGGYLNIKNTSKVGSIANQWYIYNMTGGYGNALTFWSYNQNNTGLQGKHFSLRDNGEAVFHKGLLGVGITPTQPLDVVGNARISGSLIRPDNTASAANFGNGTNLLFGEQKFVEAGGNIVNLVAKNTGEIGIGTSTPTTKLHVVGTNPARLEGLVTANSSSDLLLTADATGVVRQRTVANLFASAPIPTMQQITDAGGGTTTGGISVASLTANNVGTTTNTNFNLFRQSVSRMTFLSGNNKYYAPYTHIFETDYLTNATLQLKNFNNTTNLFVNDKFTNVTTTEGDIVLMPTGVAMKVNAVRKDLHFGQNARQNVRIKATLEIGGGGTQVAIITDTTALMKVYCNAGDEADAGNVTLYINLPTNPQNDAVVKVVAMNIFTSFVFQAASGQTIANTATYYPLKNEIFTLQFLSNTEGSSAGVWIIKKQ